MTGARPIDVHLKAIWIAGVGYRYDVLLDGNVIVRRSRDPEHEAARALHDRGLRGQFRTIDFHTGEPRMILDIARAAKLSIVERNDTGLIVVAHRPMSDEDKARARMHRSDLGRPAPPARVQGTAVARKRTGGERGVTSRRVLPPTDANGSRVPASANFEAV